MSVKVKGIGNVIKRLQRTDVAIQEEIKQEVEETSATAEARMKALAPEDTGAYKQTIDTRAWDDGLSAAVGPNPEKLKAANYPVNLPIWHEHGTSKMRRTPHVTIVGQIIRGPFVRRMNKRVRAALKLGGRK